MMKNNKPKIIFMGSSDFAVPALEELNKVYDVALVVVQPDKKRGRGNKLTPLPVKKKALELDLPVFQPENISTSESEEVLKEVGADLFIVCAYGQILKENILDIPEYGSLNIHGSVLPELRGAAPVHRAILNGMDESGISIMLLDSGMDTGPVLAQNTVEINDQTTVGELHDKLAEIGARTLVDTIPLYLEGSLTPTEQDHNSATYADKIEKEEGRVDWNLPAKNVLRRINGLDPFPSAFLEIDNKKIKIFKPELLDVQYDYKPGTILVDNNEKMLIVCKDNEVLQINELQYPGKKRMKVKDFLRGNSLPMSIAIDSRKD